MPLSHRRSAAWLLAAGLVGLLVVWFIPLDVAPSVRLPATLVAGAEWTIERSGQGTITARLEERLQGISNRYLVQSVDRGDVAELVLRPGLRAGATVSAGDTVGVLRSSATDYRMTEIEGLVSVTASELAALEQGEKETMIREARTRLASVRTLIDVQERIVGRLRTLSETGATAVDELDRAMAELVALEGEAEVTEAQIAVLESGARPADRALASSRLEAARAQLEAIRAQRGALVIRAPLAGTVTLSPGDSVLVRVVDQSRWAVIIPLPIDQRGTLTTGKTVVLDPQGRVARVSHVDPTVHRVGGQPVILVLAAGEGERPDALDHETVSVRVDTDPVRLRTWFVRELQSLLRWQNWFGHAERV